MEYVTRWRLFRIRAEVMQTDRPINIIAEECGWRSRTSCKSFKDLFGMSLRDARAAVSEYAA
ncbi:transcriptional regulator GlxA family with amidase domain [Rhizobium halophytocola]|uniref:Transcriptional regulator GlxA family with amidase domain n=2 Tax=Rhizobium halophytocola TaxID=735519 RepID=A0ABS4E4K5_9HYPH|nr:transcriptional regulator GlxA family with amidase domain [Rhizobium halophytocola]